MMSTSVPAAEAPKPPLGIIDSITSGFEVVNGQLTLALFPLALDLFLWLGPKLSIKPLMTPLISNLQFLYAYNGDPTTLQQFELVRAALTDFGERYNVFSALSTAPLGVPSFMWRRMPDAVPPGFPATVWPITHFLAYLALLGLFTLAGLFLGALYFGSIAQQVRDARLNLLELCRQVWLDWARLTAFMVLTLMALVMLVVPVLMVGGLITQFVPLVGVLVSALAFTLAMWLVFYVGFTVQGIVLKRRGLFGALWDSLRVAQGSFPYTAGLYTVVLLISFGLSAVWNLAAPNTWVMLAALGGHALVSTGLVAATFVFYQDRYRWWTEMRQAQKSRAAQPKTVGSKS